MLQSLDSAKAHEIMARFRPIAPKPPATTNSHDEKPSADAIHLRARPRKRSRAALDTNFFPTAVCVVAEKTKAIPVEQDLLQKLQEPKVISPQPLRPIGSCITVGSITPLSRSAAWTVKRADEVEEGLEFDPLPVIVSDSNNRVRLANSAYKEMVGQPECPWLDSMDARLPLGLKPTRISGEVTLRVSDLPAHGFSCRAKIEWACKGRKCVIDAPCDVMRLSCDSKDYLYTWRFRTPHASASTCIA